MTGAVPHAPAVGVKETGIRCAAAIGAGSMGGGIAAHAVAELVRRPATQARIGHMPQTGTPLRN